MGKRSDNISELEWKTQNEISKGIKEKFIF